MLCKTIPPLFKTLRINSFPLRLNPVPQRNISCICLSKTLPSHSSRFRRTSSQCYSVTNLVYSMFFQSNSSSFQTILLRVNSMRFLCYSQPFESFLRLHITCHCSSIPLLNFAALRYSIAILDNSYPFRCPTSRSFSVDYIPNKSSKSVLL